MTFDFSHITGPESSRELNFSSLCNRLVLMMDPGAQPVEGKGGDEGIDTFIGDFDGNCIVFQHKYFVSTLSQSQRRQITKSLDTALKGKRQVHTWVLMLAKDLTPAEIRWFGRLQAAYPSTKLEWWGKTKLQDLLGKHPEVARDYQPKPTVVVVMVSSGLTVQTEDAANIASALRQAVGTNPPEEVLLAAAKDLKNRAVVKILIWGPGPSGGDIYQKRLELRKKLQQLGHTVHFSEDVCTTDLLTRTGLNLSVAELIQAVHYDYIVCFMASPGSIGEVHDFARVKKIAAKMMICVDNRHREGYSGKGVLHIFEGYNGKLDWFEYPTDIRDCHLASRVIEQIHKVAEMKQWEISVGRVTS